MEMRNVKKPQSGFSLVEVLVYLAVTVLIAGAGVTTYLSLDTVLVRNATERAINHSAVVALERLGSDIRGARSINTVESAFGTTAGALALVSGTSTVRFSLESGRLMVAENGVMVGPLTRDDVMVDAFRVDRYVGTSTDLVRVSLTLSGSSKAASTTRTYYTSGVLRGSYE